MNRNTTFAKTEALLDLLAHDLAEVLRCAEEAQDGMNEHGARWVLGTIAGLERSIAAVAALHRSILALIRHHEGS